MSDTKAAAPERDPEVLGIFIEESIDGLGRVERLLLDAEGGQPAPDLFAQVFRDLHTIKGTSGYLSLPKILALSHAGEDLLAKLRDRPSAARPQHYGTLLVVVEVLRRLVERVRGEGDEGEEAGLPALVAQLEQQAHDVMADEAQSSPASAEDRPSSSAAPGLSEPVEDRPTTSAAPGPSEPVEDRPTTPAPVAIEAAPRASAPVSPSGVEAAPRASTPVSPSGVEAHAKPPEPAAAPPIDEPTAKPTDTAADASAPRTDGTVRVSVGVLDRLMNLMGELVLSRNQIVQMLKATGDTGGQAVQRLSLVTSELQEQIMKTRMQPIARVFEKIPRMVRDLSQATSKRVACTIDGNATEIDKAVVEAIRDPVMHAVRNAIDHGIEKPADRLAAGKPEQGTLSVRAFHEAGTVTIEIRDDGRGIDPKRVAAHAVNKGLLTAAQAAELSDREAIELIFRPGFSTAEKVTQISGRGVGMDVVRTQVERAGGQVEIDSVVGSGTVLRMKMPLTLAIIPALMVRSGSQRFAIPQVNLTELLHLQPDQAAKGIEYVRGSPVYRLRGEILPLVDLAKALGTDKRADAQKDGVDVVVVEAGPCRYGLVVDEIHDTEEIVIKPLHGALKRLSCYAGATVLGDGGVALILEIAGLATQAGLSTAQRREAARLERASDGSSTQTLLVFTAGGAPCAVPLGMVTRLEKVKHSAIERVAGAEVVQYRDRLMPVVRPEQLLPLGEGTPRDEQQLLVFDFGRVVALAVDEILDVTTVELKDEAFQSPEPYTQAKVVAFGKTTLVLDAFAIVRARVPDLVAERRKSPSARPVVLVADTANALRTALSTHLRTRGFDVQEFPTAEALSRALKASRGAHVGAVVLDGELDGLSPGLVESLGRDHRGVPVLVWGADEDEARREALQQAGAVGWVPKLDRDEVTAQVEALARVFRRRADDQKARAA